MTCDQVGREIISRRDSVLSRAASEHLVRCESCLRLVRTLADDGAVGPATGQLDQIKAAIVSDLRPVSPIASPFVLIALLSVVCTGVLAAGALRFGMRGWHAFPALLGLLRLTPAVIGICLLMLALIRQMVPGSRTVTTPIVGASFAFVTWGAVIYLAFDRLKGALLAPEGLRCFALGVLYVTGTAILLMVVIRRGAIQSAPLLGATLGALAGYVALAGSELRCPNPNGDHILLWHLPLVAAGAIGGMLAVAGAAWMRLRLLSPQFQKT